MTLDPSRVREMFWLFSKVLPLGQENEEVNKQIFGASVAQILPELAQTIGHQASKNLDLLDEYFDFISQAISYCRLETNEAPEVEYDQDKIKDLMKKQIEEFDKSAKST